LFAAPGVGKSTTASGLFYKMKLAGVNVELAREYAKDLVWSSRLQTLDDQIYVFGKQHHRIFTLLKDVDVIISDCPLVMQLIYSTKYPECFADTVKWAFNQYDNLNYVLERTKAYNPKGRTQTLEESDKLQTDIYALLIENHIPYQRTTGDEAGLEFVFNDVMEKING
jgi:hypothetical protein